MAYIIWTDDLCNLLNRFYPDAIPKFKVTSTSIKHPDTEDFKLLYIIDGADLDLKILPERDHFIIRVESRTERANNNLGTYEQKYRCNTMYELLDNLDIILRHFKIISSL